MRIRGRLLYKWIVLGCIALIIPLICAVINFFINKSLVERKINQVNDFLLQSIGDNIDSQLSTLLETARYYLLNQDFALYEFNVADPHRFLDKVQECFLSLRLTKSARPDLDVMLYLREKDYLITSLTANRTEYIYNSLKIQKKLTVSLETWKQALACNDQNGFQISDLLSYGNCGKESLVYSSPLLYSDTASSGYLIISVPSDFIDRLMQAEAMLGHSVLILNRQKRIIGQYGAGLDADGLNFKEMPDGTSISFESDNEKYMGSSTISPVSGWNYVICMPERIFMQEVLENRNINLAIVLLGAIAGAAAMILLQRRNYRPIRRLMDILPECDGDRTDEFDQVEKSLQKLYAENQLMQNSMEKRQGHDRELALLCAIKGRSSFYQSLSRDELLGADYQNRQFAFVVISLDIENNASSSGTSIDRNLLRFLIDNITMEILGGHYHYVKTSDDSLLVYLFLINRENQGEWKRLSIEKFQWLNDFFQNRLGTDLTITLGTPFDNFDYVESAYAEISEINEQRHYTQPGGVVWADSIHIIDFSSAGRLSYYVKRFGEMASASDFTTARTLSGELFLELASSGKAFNEILYYVLSIANSVLMMSHGLMQEKAIREDLLENALAQMRKTESLNSLQNAFFHLLKLILHTVDLDSRDCVRLSDRICEYVASHYADSSVNISAIAAQIGLTPRYMSRIFKDQTGLNLLNYINDVRIEHAKVLLKTTSKTLEEIAGETGFTNVKTLRRNFQKATGVNTANYKKA